MKRPRVNRQAVVGTVLEYVWMIFGMFIYSFGWLACIMPANTLGGGAAGLSLLFYHITGLPIGMLTLIVNGVLLLIGGTIVGWNFGMKTIFCIAMLSVTMSVLQPLLAAVTPAGQTLFALDPVSDRILLVILGGIIAGIGIAICFRQGGSTGGTDIIAMIVNKYKTISYGRIVMTVDSMIILSSLFVGDMGVDSVIYGFVVTAVLGYTVDVIQAGNQQIIAVCPQGDDIPPHHAGIAAVITGQPSEALPAFEGLLKIEGNSTGEPGGILCHSLSSCRFRRWVS